MRLLLCLALVASLAPAKAQDDFKLAIIHVNDFHAKFEETDMATNVCKPGNKCIGGYARIVTKVKELLKKHEDKERLYLNAGDNFSGSLWYSMFRAEVTYKLLNVFPADVMTLGNHEFDHGIEGVEPFLRNIESPMVVANIDTSGEPSLSGFVNKSVVLERGGRKIGVIGCLLTSTEFMAETGNIKFSDETESVRLEAGRLAADDVDIIIVLSHSGLSIDSRMAKEVGPHVDLIVGAHSHTFLYSGADPPGPDRPAGPYPVVVTQESGHKIPIVQASAYAKYIGEFEVTFDREGNLVSWAGNPVFLDSDVVPDPEIVAAMAPWKTEVDKKAWVELGDILARLELSPCVRGECALANLITDSFQRAAIKRAADDEWTNAEIAYINTGGIRTSLEKGTLFYGDAATILPFQHDLILFDIRGDKLLQTIESSISELDGTGLLLHHAGLKVTANMKNPPNERVLDVKVLCRKCKTPFYEPLDLWKDYRVIAPRYVAFNTGPYKAFGAYGRNRVEAEVDVDAFAEHIQAKTPIFQTNEGRWTFV